MSGYVAIRNLFFEIRETHKTDLHPIYRYN